MVVATVWLAHNRQNIDWQLPYRWVVRVLAFVTAYVGLLEFIDDIRFDNLDEPAAVIGGLIVYIGCGLMFVGARQMKDGG